jgi:PAS domain S-box-containing protein
VVRLPGHGPALHECRLSSETRRGGDVIGIVHISRDITEHVASKERIREERGRLEAILASLDTGLSLINRDLTVAWVNEKITNIFPGPSPVGAVCHTCYANRDIPCPECPAIKAFKSGHVEQGERHDPDSGKWYSIIAQPVKDAAGNTIQVLEGITDSTSRKRAEEALAKSEKKWRHILATAPQIGISLDPRGGITFANDHFLKLTGWQRDEVIGRDWFTTFVPESTRDEVRGIFETVMTEKHIHGFSNYENEILHRNGSLLTVAWSNVLTRDPNGSLVDVTCMGIDVTERRRAEEALLRARRSSRASSRIPRWASCCFRAVVSWSGATNVLPTFWATNPLKRWWGSACARYTSTRSISSNSASATTRA